MYIYMVLFLEQGIAWHASLRIHAVAVIRISLRFPIPMTALNSLVNRQDHG
jgi:hypothetical protein